MKKIAVKAYTKLRPGEVYDFQSFAGERFERDGKSLLRFKPSIVRRGKLLFVSTRWRVARDLKGKEISRELVGDRLAFVPDEDTAIWEFTGEVLKVYECHICCGLFQIYEVEDGDVGP